MLNARKSYTTEELVQSVIKRLPESSYVFLKDAKTHIDLSGRFVIDVRTYTALLYEKATRVDDISIYKGDAYIIIRFEDGRIKPSNMIGIVQGIFTQSILFKSEDEAISWIQKRKVSYLIYNDILNKVIRDYHFYVHSEENLKEKVVSEARNRGLKDNEIDEVVEYSLLNFDVKLHRRDIMLQALKVAIRAANNLLSINIDEHKAIINSYITFNPDDEERLKFDNSYLARLSCEAFVIEEAFRFCLPWVNQDFPYESFPRLISNENMEDISRYVAEMVGKKLNIKPENKKYNSKFSYLGLG